MEGIDRTGIFILFSSFFVLISLHTFPSSLQHKLKERQLLEALPAGPDGIPAHLIPPALPANPDEFADDVVTTDGGDSEPMRRWGPDLDEEEQLARAIRASLGTDGEDVFAIPEVSLRDEQDQAYLESLLQDKRKEERRLEEEEEGALLKAIEMSKQDSIEYERRRLRASLTAEPPEGAEGVCVLAIRLPNGVKVQRRMLAEDTIGALRTFVAAQRLDHPDAIPDEFHIVMDYPRRQFDDDSVTLRAAGMCPRAAVNILSASTE